MSKKRKKETSQQEKRIKELEESLKRLRAAKPKDHDLKDDNGITKVVLDGIANAIPGLNGLFKFVEKTELFQERLKEIDEEVGKRLHDTALKKVASTKNYQSKGASMHNSGAGKEEKVFRDIPVDIFDEGNNIEVIAELSGAEEKDIKVELRSEALIISAYANKIKYFKKLQLPYKFNGIIKKLYKNGILEVVLEKLTEEGQVNYGQGKEKEQ